VNVEGTHNIADWCRSANSGLLFASSDWVYDGQCGPYDENREARPATVYGRTKLAAEGPCASLGTIARLGPVLNDIGHVRRDFYQDAIDHMRRGERVNAVTDEWRSPVNASQAAAALLCLAKRNVKGIVNVGGERSGTPLDFLQRAAAEAGVNADLIVPTSRLALGHVDRPRDVRLDSHRLRTMMTDENRFGVIIPVHNGAHCLGETLGNLATQTRAGMTVVVVVNGSSDKSAEVGCCGLEKIASTGASTRLLVLPSASRAKALDAGDAIVGDVDRLYIDQDAILGPHALERIYSALRDGADFIGAKAEWRGGTSAVQAAMAAWNALRYVERSPATAGAYAVSAAGRRRWADWPDNIPDDKFARLNFRPAERRRLPDAVYGVEAPTNFSDLVAARCRYHRSNIALRTAYPELLQNDLSRGPTNLAGLSLRQVPGLSILLAAHMAARLRVG